MAQRMQQPDEQDSSQPSAPMDSSQGAHADAQVPAVKQQQQPDEKGGADQASAAKQPDAATSTVARVFPHVHQPATAAKKANPKLGPLDRRKGRPQASHAEILTGTSYDWGDAGKPCQK